MDKKGTPKDKNAFHIEIENFQKISHAEIEIPNGITIMTGANAEGKTATIRAVISALFNVGDDKMIKAGTNCTTVTISDNENKMVFKRDGKSKSEKTIYSFNDKDDIKKVGRNQLQEVIDMFNITDVKLSNNNVARLNFALQGEQPFLTGLGAKPLFEFLSTNSSKDYVKVIKEMTADIKAYDKETNDISVSIDTLKTINNSKQEILDKNKNFDEVYIKIKEAKSKEVTLNQIVAMLQNIDVLTNQVSEKEKRLSNINNELNKIDFKVVSEKMIKITEKDAELKEIKKQLNAISILETQLNDLTISFKEVSTNYDKSSLIVNEVKKKLVSIKEKSDRLSEIRKLLQGYDDTNAKIIVLKDSLNSLNSNTTINIKELQSKISDLATKSNELDKIKVALANIDALEKQIDSKNAEILVIKEKIQKNDEEMKKFDVCPLCGHKL